MKKYGYASITAPRARAYAAHTSGSTVAAGDGRPVDPAAGTGDEEDDERQERHGLVDEEVGQDSKPSSSVTPARITPYTSPVTEIMSSDDRRTARNQTESRSGRSTSIVATTATAMLLQIVKYEKKSTTRGTRPSMPAGFQPYALGFAGSDAYMPVEDSTNWIARPSQAHTARAMNQVRAELRRGTATAVGALMAGT